MQSCCGLVIKSLAIVGGLGTAVTIAFLLSGPLEQATVPVNPQNVSSSSLTNWPFNASAGQRRSVRIIPIDRSANSTESIRPIPQSEQARSGEHIGQTSGQDTRQCDDILCVRTVSSSRVSECTTRHSDSELRPCTLHARATESSVTGVPAYASVEGSGPHASPLRSCNRQACSRAYRSFDELTCTYQPFSGPRRICTK
jgi:BA14K-like protein